MEIDDIKISVYVIRTAKDNKMDKLKMMSKDTVQEKFEIYQRSKNKELLRIWIQNGL